jgi:hypothetical protein
LPPEDCEFLRKVRQTPSRHYKNISYRPGEKQVKGFDRKTASHEALLRIFQSYSSRVNTFATQFLRPYAGQFTADYSSFRPIEEDGRPLPVRLRNDLLHVDSFPTRPSMGNRILRIFTNLNPTRPRVWLTGPPFEQVAIEHAKPAGLLEICQTARTPLGRIRNWMEQAARDLHLPVAGQSPYDRFMHCLHHYLKANHQFQDSCSKSYWEFPPLSTWMVYTDLVLHAVISGQYALEQTFIVRRQAMALPARAPISVLERICDVPLAN